ADAAQGVDEQSYPPYSIERLDENSFQISVALAGFKPDEVELTVEQNVLTLEGRKSDKEGRTFLHRGISARNFKRQFTLTDHVEVKGARFENGPLIIDLQQGISEAMKPLRIAINGVAPKNLTHIEANAASDSGDLDRSTPRGAYPARLPLNSSQIWRQPCGRRPPLTTTFSISTISFIPAPSSSTRGTWCLIR